jgi:hypothetical protein
MAEKRVEFNKIVKNQLPSYVKEEFPLIGEFLTQYYLGQEYKGAPIDLIQNIDSYIKLNENGNDIEFTTLSADLTTGDVDVFVDNTSGFPDNNGLIKIGNEIITYESKTDVSFVSCTRGFSGITSFTDTNNNPESFVFSTSNSVEHNQGDVVENLSDLFLQKFFEKTKKQLLPGLSNVSLPRELNQAQFLRSSRDFYSSRGTDASFKILFSAIYGKDAKIIRPSDYLISPSNANYRKTKDFVVEILDGNPNDLVNNTLFQDEFENIPKAYSPVSAVQKLATGVSGEEYYKISLDGSYINKEGSSVELIYDKFSIHPKTKCLQNVSVGQTYIDVDSTVGFPNSGTLTFRYFDETIGISTYSGKTVNQFLGVSNVEKRIIDGSNIEQNTFAYSSTGVNLKIRSVLNSLEYPQNTHTQKRESKVKIKSLGKIGKNAKQNNWIFNNSQTYDVKSIEIIDSRNFVYRFLVKDEILFRVGDTVKLKNKNDEILENIFEVINVVNSTTCLIRGSDIIDTNTIVSVKREISKVNSSSYGYLNKFTSNVQNAYIDKDDVLIASNSLPSFGKIAINPDSTRIVFSGTFENENPTLKITDTTDHNFYTGDIVYYTPEKNDGGTILSNLFDEGIYFVKRVDQNSIKLAKSRANIYKNIFVSPDFGAGQEFTISNNIIEKYRFRNKIIQPQKLIRKLSTPVPNIDNLDLTTLPGNTGIFVNGVEILNYKSPEFVYYGKINGIEVTSPGSNFDVINPPFLHIGDDIGIGATGSVSVRGQFKEIQVIDGGFDYIETPTIEITGGNGSQVIAEASMTNVKHEVSFNSSNSGIATIGLGTDASTIGFSTFHKFREGDAVRYITSGNKALLGLSTNSTYYVSSVDAYTLKLHSSELFAKAGIGTVIFTDYGEGIHSLLSLKPKQVVSSIRIVNPGINYENKKRSCSQSGINTSLNVITIENHGYKSGEIIEYTYDGESISGLSTTKQYYAVKLDNNRFRLSSVGIGTTDREFKLKTAQYENLTSVGFGTHVFNYPEIKVTVTGSVGISSVEGKTFKASVQPIVRGEIIGVDLTNRGEKYGSSDIIGFEREPNITLRAGQQAELYPVISNGSIVDVVINNPGKDYFSIPDLEVIGDGSSAKLFPIITNGRITNVIINQKGIDYTKEKTSIIVKNSGSGVYFKSYLQKWRINEFARKKSTISGDDLILALGKRDDLGLQCNYMYAPRDLRRLLYSTDRGNRIVYGQSDLTLENGIEVNSINHSPIIGWAYDGNPIYGPYGYSSISGGSITQLKSGYSLDLKSGRPPTSDFPVEFFVEDFTWFNNNDDTILDENNGRYCVTPEYPNGVYAYFATIDTVPSADGIFKGFKQPVFPYLIGSSYKSSPISFNFKKRSNQDEFDLSDGKWSRNTKSYALDKKNSGYDYLTESYKNVEQDSTIKFVSRGSIDYIGISSGGANYRVGDNVLFQKDELTGYGALARVSELSGVGINSVDLTTSKIFGVEFVPNGLNSVLGIYTAAHNLKSGESVYVSGLSTTKFLQQNFYDVGIVTTGYSLRAGINSSGTTGLTTYMSITGDLSQTFIRENDTLKIGIGGSVYSLGIRQTSPQVGTAITSKALTESSTRTTDAEVYDYIWDNYSAFDADGDGVVSYNDALILTRYHFGSAFSGDRLIGGVEFPINATRTRASDIRDFIGIHSTTTHDIDGDGSVTALGDMIMLVRVVSDGFKNPSDTVPSFIKLEEELIEEVKVLNIEQESSRIRVLRSINNISGPLSAGAPIEKVSRRFILNNTGLSTNLKIRTSKEYYFDPSESIGIGDDISVGAGTTISFSNVGVGATQLFVPTRSIYLPKHQIETGDILRYKVNYGDTIGVSTVGGGGSIPLSDFSSLYAIKFDDNTIGISSVKVGVGSTGTYVGTAASTKHQGLLYFVGLGTGTYHSFTFTSPYAINGNVEKNTVNVTTASTHGLLFNDIVNINVNPNNQTTIKVKYDSHNKKLLFNEYEYSTSGISSDTNTITITDHKLKKGQKVINFIDSGDGEREFLNKSQYYVYVIDNDNIKLTNNRYELGLKEPSFVGLSTLSDGHLSLVNPQIDAYRDSTIIFDLSDSSLSYLQDDILYPAFYFKVFEDEGFTNEFYKSKDDLSFSTNSIGDVGITTDAKVSLFINKNTPKNLYYRLIPLNNDNNPNYNKDIVIDDDVFLNNQISVKNSLFNGRYSVSAYTDNTFSYILDRKAESTQYLNTQAVLKYTTSSNSAYGPIHDVSIYNKGKNYTSTPFIEGIRSEIGEGAVLQAYSKDIGRIKKVSIDNIGYDYPSDLTLRPTSNIPQVLKLDQLATFKSIGITTAGVNYSFPPQLVVVDAITNSIVDDVELAIDDLDSTSVRIVQNTTNLSDSIPKIIPTGNSNGIGVTNLTFDPVTKLVTAEFERVPLRFFLPTNSNRYGATQLVLKPVSDNPDGILSGISTGDKILVEGSNVGVGSTGIGFNSLNYNYALFEVVGTSVNNSLSIPGPTRFSLATPAAAGIVTYSMLDYVKDGEYPGNYNKLTSATKIIPEKYFPQFNIEIEKTEFKKNDIVINDRNLEGSVFEFDFDNKLIWIEGSDDFEVNDVIVSKATGSKGVVKEKIFFESKYNLDYYSIVDNGWQSNKGKLSDNQQRIHDNDYYQYFSYSVKSPVPIQDWQNVIDSLNHTAGYKKFSDLEVESISDTSLTPGVISDKQASIVLDNVYDLSCYKNYDLAFENYVVTENSNGESYAFSDEIIFNSKIISDYDESISNRVVVIDDVSGDFNSNPRPTRFTEVFRIPADESRSQKFIAYIKDRTYTQERQVSILTVLSDVNKGSGFINEYGVVDSVLGLGYFDYAIDGNDGSLRFYPTKFSYNNYNLSIFSYSINDFDDDLTSVSAGSTLTIGVCGTAPDELGSVASIASTETYVSGGSAGTIVRLAGIGTTTPNTRSAKILVSLEGDDGRLELNELNVIHNGSEVGLLEFGNLSSHTVTDDFSSVGMGTYWAYMDDSGEDDGSIIISFTPEVGLSTVKVGTLTIGLSTEIYNNQAAGAGATFAMANGALIAKTKEITSGTEDNVVDFPNTFDAAYGIIQVADTDNSKYQMSEFVIVRDSNQTYLTEFGNIETDNQLVNLRGNINEFDSTQIIATPIDSNVHIKTFTHAFRVETNVSNPESVDLLISSLNSRFGTYTGTENDVKRDFPLTHRTHPIFRRVFDGSDTDIVNVENNSISVPYHFFVTGEEVTYGPSVGFGTNNIQIQSTVIGGITTDKLPSSVYVIKLSESEIQFAATVEDALKKVPSPLTLTSVGIGTSHSIAAKNQNQRVLISLDNYIQSPIVSTSVTTALDSKVLVTEDKITTVGVTSFFANDYIKIDDEIMKITGVGIGSTNVITVARAWAGTGFVGHETGALVTKIRGNYNIVGNTLNFIEAPFGNTPIGYDFNPPSDRDWTGITTSSSFAGRVFMKSGVVGTSTETYSENYLFDDISHNFTTSKNTYTLTSNSSDIVGISTNNAIVLINGIFQSFGLDNNYTLSETSGITSITFNGTPSSTSTDPNSFDLPSNGTIVSVGSTEGLGYQPLVAAGGTSVVSAAGTIESITIGYSGSGYRGSTLYEIETTTSFPIGIGSTNIFLENTSSVLNILELLSTGSNCTIGVGTFILENTTIISVASTSVEVGVGSGSSYEIPSGTIVSVEINDPEFGIVNVGVATSSVGNVSITHVGFTTIYPGTGIVSSFVRITNAGIGFTVDTPPYVIFDEPLPYGNIPLIYSESSVGSGGTQAKVDIVVGQGSSVIDFSISNLGYGYGIGHVLTLPIGGVTGIPTTPSYEEFQITIDEVETDEFSAWSVGELEILDNFESLFDGIRKTFPLSVSGRAISIQSDLGSIVKVEECLLVFVNDILQNPYTSYLVNGSVITFIESPKQGDTIKIIFYKGLSGTDVLGREVVDKIQPGDIIDIESNSLLDQTDFIDQDPRSVNNIVSSSSVKTTTYYGPGLLEDPLNYRPITLCKQTRDKIINGVIYGKDREEYEPRIYPTAYLIHSVGIGSTIVYVDNVRPFFNPSNESNSLGFQNSVNLINYGEKVSAAATARVSIAGTISEIVISDGGVGYTTTPSVSIASTIGAASTISVSGGSTTVSIANATLSIGGTVSSIDITNPGIGYTRSSPPVVLIDPPIFEKETNQIISYEGDFGVIVGLGTTNVGVSTGFVFRMHIPSDSALRTSGISSSWPSLSPGDYFVITNSNVGSGITSLDDEDNIVGVGTTFIDNIYRVSGITTEDYTSVSYGTTAVGIVTVSILDYNFQGEISQFDPSTLTGIGTDFFGMFSWGKLTFSERVGVITYYPQINNGVLGIRTGPVVRRNNPLKHRNYTS